MCDKQNHPLIEIYRQSITWSASDVVRWCPDCGAIVVDREHDNRTSPGEIRKMQLPNISK